MIDIVRVECRYCDFAEFVPARDEAIWATYHEHEDDA